MMRGNRTLEAVIERRTTADLIFAVMRYPIKGEKPASGYLLVLKELAFRGVTVPPCIVN